MATTTTNYGFDIPQSTDLVKDGATAIATLGQDIDTAMNTALGTKKAGMVLLNTTSFSGVASQSFSNVFSSTYTNYTILMDVSQSTTASVLLRFRTASDDSSSVYSIQNIKAVGTSNDATRTLSGTSLNLTVVNEANKHFYDLLIMSPNTTENTSGFVRATQNMTEILEAFSVNTATQYTGFSLIASTGNLSGKASIYGYSI
jgi:hypothetical protein